LGSAVSSPNGVWGGAPAEIEFDAFYPYNMTFGGSNNYANFPFSVIASQCTTSNSKPLLVIKCK